MMQYFFAKEDCVTTKQCSWVADYSCKCWHNQGEGKFPLSSPGKPIDFPQGGRVYLMWREVEVK